MASSLACVSWRAILYDEKTSKIRHARTIKLFPEQLKWDTTLVEDIKPTPCDEHAGHDQSVAIQDGPSEPGDGDAARTVIKGIRMQLKGEDFKAFGYTVGCPRCHHERRYG